MMMHDVAEGRAVGLDDENGFIPDETPNHSLPTPEEVRTDAAIRDSESKSSEREAERLRRYRGIIICGAILCVIGLLVTTLVFFADSDTTAKDEEDGVRMERARKFLLEALPNQASKASLSFEETPHSQAMDWMVRDDPLRFDIPKSENDSGAGKFMERYIMTLLYFATNGANWNNDMRFLTGRETCAWNKYFQDEDGLVYLLGAICDGSDDINKIWIPSNMLQGVIPFDEIMQLKSLRTIGFEYNGGLEGTLPNNIGDLTQLEILSLSNNLLTGTLPMSMSDIQSLRFLMIDDNELSGEVTSVVNLPNLELVYLEDNFFEGEIGETFFSASPNLVHLDASNNEFSGTIPAHFFEESKLEVLDLMGNLFIDGRLPQFPVEQTNLKVLALQFNSITGDIPASIGNLRGLRHLDLSQNQLTGYFTEAMGDLKELNYLFLASNSFNEGPVPNFIRDLTNLVDLSLKKTNLSGAIPDWIGTDLKRLRLLDLDGNKLSGEIPETLTQLKVLTFLLLNRNQLTGQVPQNFTTVPLEVFVLDDNNLSGDLDFLCPVGDKNPLDYIVADCGGDTPEVNCTLGTCCKVCCSDEEEGCNDKDWLADYDPIWENDYERNYYSFNNELKWVPRNGGSNGS
eukprot:CAMPEP_0185741752 /NCGR_PEP_ID=MMETSP1171-20130828/38748_1 /TAXON_ID=374046 /ORGANISM="Helicotheca tamensis, Strain CCMP826" /LENGTH=627 /DNA_ID=CAMNT_0028413737 /DNA_START=41 /DNA_END=1924 /DNA_ORIENTATION=+